MNCKTVRARLHDFLEGRPSRSERREIELHLDGCPECAAMAGLLAAPPLVGGTPDLTAQVLERTSGPACDRAHEILGDAVDATLDPLDSDLLQTHLEGCEPCTALMRVMARLRDDLPAMAEIRPAPGLVEQVTAATRPRPERRAALAARWAWTWAGLVARPRIAWEAGYVGAVGVWLVVSLFGSPFRASLPLPYPPPPTEIVEEVTERAATLGQRAWSATGGRGLDTWNGFYIDVSGRYRRTEPARDALRRDGKRLTRAAWQLDLEQGARAWNDLANDARSAWERFTNATEATDSTHE